MAQTFDVHNHVGLDQAFYLRGWWPYAATAQNMIEHLERSNIDRAVVFPFGVPSAFDFYELSKREKMVLLPDRFPFDLENDLLANELSFIDTQRKLIMLAMFDPSRKVAEQVKKLRSMHAQGKFVGLKVQATVLQSPIRDLLGDGKALMEFAEEFEMPVLIHTSISPKDTWSQVSDCLEVAAAYPKARFNLAHSLRFDLPGLQAAAKAPNVWVDCSAHLAHCELARDKHAAVAQGDRQVKADYTKPAQVLEAIHAILGPKYMWGSDNPFMSWCANGINAVYSYGKEIDVVRALPKKVADDMLSIGPRAWLGKSLNF